MNLKQIDETITPDAKTIASFTGTRADAVQVFIDSNRLDASALAKFVEKGRYPERAAVIAAISGKPGNREQKALIKRFQLAESVQLRNRLANLIREEIQQNRKMKESINEAYSENIKWKETMNLKQIIKEEVKRQLREVDELGNMDLKNVTFQKLVSMIFKDWKNVNFAAKPYLSAMASMDSADDKYGYDSGKSIILYFLSNASQWKGPIAKAVKTELKRRTK